MADKKDKTPSEENAESELTTSNSLEKPLLDEKPPKETADIVLLGSFNPLIFRPDWFADNDLIGMKEADDASIEVIHREIVAFSLDWVRIEVQQNRFTAATIETVDPRLSDLVVKTFKEFLHHTPIGKLGINLSVDFGVKDLDSMSKIGEALAPKKCWGEWAKKLQNETQDVRSGLRTLIMQQNIRDDKWKGYIQARVESSKITSPAPGVSVSINDHCEVDDADDITGCSEIIKKLESDWQSSIDYAKWIIDQVMKLA